jgi:hypothetical protein
MKNKDEAHMALRQLINSIRPAKGIPYHMVGMGFGLTPRYQHLGPNNWATADLVEHEISETLCHHEKLSIARVRWHIEHYDELVSGYRPMMLFVEGAKKYIVDGCHRTAALSLSGIYSFQYLTIHTSQRALGED